MRLHCILLLTLLVSACVSSTPQISPPKDSIAPIVWPAAPEPARIQYVKHFSAPEQLGLKKSIFSKIIDWFAGAKDQRMSRPYAIDVNDSKIVVADPDASVVHLYDLQKNKYNRIRKSAKQYFAAPIGVALGNDRIFIADSKLNKVFILDQDLQTLKVLPQFKRPTGIAFDPVRQHLYVTDTLAHQIQVFDQNGQFLFRIGQRGEHNAQFNFPTHLAFADDRLFVNDTMNFRIQIFQHNGQHLQTFGKQGDVTGAFGQSKGLAVDSEGHVYVADVLSGRIQIFNQKGIFLLDFGTPGDTPGKFQLPAGLAFWNDEIYVADSYNGRIQVFRYLRQES